MINQIPTSQKKIAGARPFFHDEDVSQILVRFAEVLRSGRLIFGANGRQFEESFADYIKSKHAVAVNSCTTALEITLRFYQVEGKEVIVPTNTFASVVNAIIYAGGTPVLADMNPATFCLDTDDVRQRLTAATAGIIVVHIAGLIYPEIDSLREFCSEKNLFLIEDPSHAHGAMIDDRKAGTLGDAACFSFYPTKLMTTGTGGMITTDDGELATYARSLRHHGQGESLESIINLGSDWCMDELSAVLGIFQLNRLDESVAHRNQVVDWYRRELARVDWLEIPRYPVHLRHAYYKLPMLLDDRIDKARLRQIMLDEYQVEMGSIYDPPCHLHPVFRDRFGWCAGMFPKAERTLSRQICPPVHAQISEDDVAYVAEALRQVINRIQR